MGNMDLVETAAWKANCTALVNDQGASLQIYAFTLSLNLSVYLLQKNECHTEGDAKHEESHDFTQLNCQIKL